MNYEDQVQLALRRSEVEEKLRQMQKEHEENEAMKKAIAESMKETNEPDVEVIEDYQEQFQRTLKSCNKASPAQSPSGGKQVKKRAKFNGLPTETHPHDLRRIQESEELSLAMERSKQDHLKQRGGGGTSLPAMGGPILPEALSEEAQLQLAIELSKGEVSAENGAIPVITIPDTPPALQNGYSRAARSSPPPKSLSFGSSCSRAPLRTVPNSKPKQPKGTRRHIVMDGCNVGFEYGRHSTFNAKGLKLVHQYFIDKGWSDQEIVIFLKRPPMSRADEDLCNRLYSKGVLKWTPKRVAGSDRIVCDDDNMILDYASQIGGVIISNDQYRDSYNKFPEFRDTISKRVLQLNFINDKVLFSKHPLGMKGPTLEQFLRF